MKRNEKIHDVESALSEIERVLKVVEEANGTPVITDTSVLPALIVILNELKGKKRSLDMQE